MEYLKGLAILASERDKTVYIFFNLWNAAF